MLDFQFVMWESHNSFIIFVEYSEKIAAVRKFSEALKRVGRPIKERLALPSFSSAKICRIKTWRELCENFSVFVDEARMHLLKFAAAVVSL